jgi:UDP-2,3-diacylglucosamine hydrolase
MKKQISYIPYSLAKEKKLYFISDIHLGMPNESDSKNREILLVQWLEQVSSDAQAIFILGDLFDFWYEYKYVVPKGYTRLLGQLAKMNHSGIEIHFFVGNHDMWTYGYLENEIGFKIYSDIAGFYIDNIRILLGHGDGLGPRDYGYKVMKKIFKNNVAQKLFSMLHPYFAFKIAHRLSSTSRGDYEKHIEEFKGIEKEFIIQFLVSLDESIKPDIAIFGHRHLKTDLLINDIRYINLGTWLLEPNYAQFDGSNVLLKTFFK